MFSSKIRIMLLLVLLFGIAPNLHAHGIEMRVDFFYNSLAPYGEWIEYPSYGWVWSPVNVEPGWRPYTDGYWVFSDDYGWTYMADNEWGWAVYHYGRWTFDPQYGWLWVPGTVWAPAWVAWRHGNGYMGWAPLPPQAQWSMDAGFRVGRFDFNVGIDWGSWAFVQNDYFLDRDVHRRIVVPARNVTIINITNNVTNYTVINNRVVNQSFRVNDVERYTNRKVTHFKFEDEDMNVHNHRYVMTGNTVKIFHPVIINAKPVGAPKNVIIHTQNRPFDDMKLKLDKYHNQQKQELKIYHNEELKKAQNNLELKGQIEARHNEELRKLDEQQHKEKIVIENTYKRNQNKDQVQVKVKVKVKVKEKKKK